MRLPPSTDISMVNINRSEEKYDSKQSKLKTYSLKAAVFLTYILSVVAAYVVMAKKNIKMAEEDYFIYITPPKVFFNIWIVIYITLFGAMVHNLWRDVWQIKSTLILIYPTF
jgi:hypothetical protein